MPVHLAGKDGYVSIGVGTIQGIKSWTLDYVTDVLETTDFADAGVKSYIVGCSGWSGSFEGYKYAASIAQGSAVTLSLYESAGAYWYSAASSTLIIGTHASVGHDGIVSVSYDFQGSGLLSHTEA